MTLAHTSPSEADNQLQCVNSTGVAAWTLGSRLNVPVATKAAVAAARLANCRRDIWEFFSILPPHLFLHLEGRGDLGSLRAAHCRPTLEIMAPFCAIPLDLSGRSLDEFRQAIRATAGIFRISETLRSPRQTGFEAASQRRTRSIRRPSLA